MASVKNLTTALGATFAATLFGFSTVALVGIANPALLNTATTALTQIELELELLLQLFV